MSNRRSILMLLAGIVLLVAAHFAVDCSRGGVAATSGRTALLADSESAMRIEIVRGGEAPTVIVRTNDVWRLVSPFPAVRRGRRHSCVTVVFRPC